jgi:hypothetical protein
VGHAIFHLPNTQFSPKQLSYHAYLNSPAHLAHRISRLLAYQLPELQPSQADTVIVARVRTAIALRARRLCDVLDYGADPLESGYVCALSRGAGTATASVTDAADTEGDADADEAEAAAIERANRPFVGQRGVTAEAMRSLVPAMDALFTPEAFDYAVSAPAVAAGADDSESSCVYAPGTSSGASAGRAAEMWSRLQLPRLLALEEALTRERAYLQRVREQHERIVAAAERAEAEAEAAAVAAAAAAAGGGGVGPFSGPGFGLMLSPNTRSGSIGASVSIGDDGADGPDGGNGGAIGGGARRSGDDSDGDDSNGARGSIGDGMPIPGTGRVGSSIAPVIYAPSVIGLGPQVLSSGVGGSFASLGSVSLLAESSASKLARQLSFVEPTLAPGPGEGKPPRAGGPGYQPLNPPYLGQGQTSVSFTISRLGVKEAGSYRDPRVTVSLVDGAGAAVGPAQDTPFGAAQSAAELAWPPGTTVHLQEPLERLDDGWAVVFELRHSKKDYLSTRVWAFIERRGLEAAAGRPLQLELYEKPADFARNAKNMHAYTKKPLYLHVTVNLMRS